MISREMRPSRHQSADAVHAWLNALDPNAGERAELLGQGVSASTVDALYPTGFAAIIPGLVEHVKQADLSGLNTLQRRDQIQLVGQGIKNAVDAIPASISGEYVRDFYQEGTDSTALDPLIDAIANGRFSSDGVPLAAALWNAWWLMEHKAEISALSRQNAEIELSWLGTYLLQLPIAK